MNCSQCGSSIDYRFATSCLNCNCEVVLPKTDASLVGPTDKPRAALKLKFRHHLTNLTTTLAATVAGWFIGAVVSYLGGWGVYFFLYKASIVGDLSCGGGSFLAFLLLIGGANIGSVGAGIFGYANRLYRPSVSRVCF